MSINRRLASLSKDELKTFVWRLLDVFFREENRINLEKEWGSDTFEEIKLLLDSWGLHPETAWKWHRKKSA